MRPIRQIYIITLILLLSTINFYPLIEIKSVTAAPASGNTNFYFVDYIENYGIGGDFVSGTYAPISEFPPSKTNDSYYPPLLVKELKNNPEKYIEWISFWGYSLLGEYGGYEGYSDIFDQLSDYFPNPLRIMESYEYNGDDTLLLDGDVTFNLDFNTIKAIRNAEADKVNVSLYSMGSILPQLLNSTITTITPPSSLSKTHSQTIVVKNVQHTLQPGSSLIFSIEIIPGNKTITSSILNKDTLLFKLSKLFADCIINFADKLENPEIEYYLDFYQELKNISSSFNFSSEDAEEIINSIVGPSLVYDSINHQCSVTVPFQSSSDASNTMTYYLDETNILNENNPTGDAKSLSIAEGKLKWTSASYPRSKLINSADAVLYINHKDISVFKDSMEVQASLLINNNSIASDQITFDKSGFVSSTKRYHLSFDNIASGTEISYDDSISILIELKNETDLGQGLIRSIDIFYDGSDYPSYLTLSLSETEHISVTQESSPINKKIIPGDVVTYSLNVTSDFDDDISIQYVNSSFSDDEQAYWEIDISIPTFTIQSEQTKTATIDLKSSYYSLLAYEEEPLEIDVEIIGKTGYVVIPLSAEVSEDAVIFDTNVKSPESKTIKHGENHTYVFNITNNNTGLWPNSFIFTALSNNNWTVNIDPYTFDNLGYGNSTNVKVTLNVPKNTKIVTDIITFKVISKENGDEIVKYINSTIQGEIALENLFGFFESLAEDFGLDESFGEFAPYIIPIILIIVIFFIIILMVFIITSKNIELICVDRIKEIYPHESATYTITIRNPSSKNRTYYMDVIFDNEDHKWDFSLDQKTILVQKKQSKTIHLNIKPTDEINLEEWIKATLLVATDGIKKQSKIELMAMIKNGIIELSIQNVFHWPKYFKKDEKVTTSFKLYNTSNIQAKNIKIQLLINGMEKNKVEDIIIPARGHADISIPWIAVKGKNDISIVVT